MPSISVAGARPTSVVVISTEMKGTGYCHIILIHYDWKQIFTHNLEIKHPHFRFCFHNSYHHSSSGPGIRLSWVGTLQDVSLVGPVHTNIHFWYQDSVPPSCNLIVITYTMFGFSLAIFWGLYLSFNMLHEDGNKLLFALTTYL